MNKNVVAVAVIAALGVGFAGGYGLSGSKAPPQMEAADRPSAERKALFYRNPMNPAISSPVMMQDDMGMDYIPVYADGGSGDEPAGTVTIDPVKIGRAHV